MLNKLAGFTKPALYLVQTGNISQKIYICSEENDEGKQGVLNQQHFGNFILLNLICSKSMNSLFVEKLFLKRESLSRGK